MDTRMLASGIFFFCYGENSFQRAVSGFLQSGEKKRSKLKGREEEEKVAVGPSLLVLYHLGRELDSKFPKCLVPLGASVLKPLQHVPSPFKPSCPCMLLPRSGFTKNILEAFCICSCKFSNFSSQKQQRNSGFGPCLNALCLLLHIELCFQILNVCGMLSMGTWVV